jgi:hypothetical protein
VEGCWDGNRPSLGSQPSRVETHLRDVDSVEREMWVLLLPWHWAPLKGTVSLCYSDTPRSNGIKPSISRVTQRSHSLVITKRIWKWLQIRTVEYYSVLKRNEYQAMTRHTGTLSAYSQVREARTHAVQLQWHDILEMAELWRGCIRITTIDNN